MISQTVNRFIEKHGLDLYYDQHQLLDRFESEFGRDIELAEKIFLTDPFDIDPLAALKKAREFHRDTTNHLETSLERFVKNESTAKH